jgi:tetratricopeptide (TPR) repeat protein
MAIKVVLPELGENDKEATVARWLKQEGDRIAEGESVVEVETDKVTIEIEAQGAGILLKIEAAEGQTVPVGALLAYIGQPGEPLGENKTTEADAVLKEMAEEAAAAPAAMIHLDATEMSREEAETVLAALYQQYYGRSVDDTDRSSFVPILQSKGFAGLAYVLDQILHSDEMKERARAEMVQIWQEHLNYPPTEAEREIYERRIRFFREQEKAEIIATVNRAKACNQQAEPLLQAGSLQLAEARQLLDKAVAGGLANAYIWHNHALVRYWQSDYEAAVPSYHKAILYNPDDDYIYSCEDLKWCYGGLGEQDATWYEKGLYFFQRIVEEFPNRWIAYHECGWLLLKMQRFDEAIAYYEQAIVRQTDPMWGWSYVDLLLCHEGNEQQKEAYRHFSTLARAGATNWGIWHALSTLELKYLNNPTSALEAYGKAIQYHPHGGDNWTWEEFQWFYTASKTFEPQKYHQAYNAFVTAREKRDKKDPESWHIWQGMGWAKERLTEWREAITYYQNSLGVNPASTWSWLGLARCYRKRRNAQFINAWEAYQQLLELAPQHGNDEQREMVERGLELLGNKHLVALRRLLQNHFDLGEIRALCFDLNIKYDNLSGSTLPLRVISLIEYCERWGQLGDLINSVRAVQPRLIPPLLPEVTHE